MTATITKTVGRDLPNGDYMEIEAELHGDEGTLSPGFGVMCLIWAKSAKLSGRSRKHRGYDADSGGADHATILAIMPEFAPLVVAHLADPDGLPLHAVTNGWYFYSGSASAYERKMIAKGDDFGYSKALKSSDHDRAAQALHISPNDLPQSLTKEGFAAFVASLADVHHAQAVAARAILAALVNGDGVEPTN